MRPLAEMMPERATPEPTARAAVIPCAPSVHPLQCPRCVRGAVRGAGRDWCCRELSLLEALMTADAPPTMNDVRARFPKRTPLAIERACARYGFKLPQRDGRRRRCPACDDLFRGPRGAVCCPMCVQGKGV